MVLKDMIIRVDQKTNAEDFDQQRKKLPKSKKKSLSDFYGKLKGVSVKDVITNRKLRNEWK
ncbi:hypothetical protein A0256_02490 [Mucilaginibacter sp. PAMC 26640]|nr:hypothetical protein A0256_02490 [Mucilaginibacter sp. PAMC 26640]